MNIINIIKSKIEKFRQKIEGFREKKELEEVQDVTKRINLLNLLNEEKDERIAFENACLAFYYDIEDISYKEATEKTLEYGANEILKKYPDKRDELSDIQDLLKSLDNLKNKRDWNDVYYSYKDLRIKNMDHDSSLKAATNGKIKKDSFTRKFNLFIYAIGAIAIITIIAVLIAIFNEQPKQTNSSSSTSSTSSIVSSSVLISSNISSSQISSSASNNEVDIEKEVEKYMDKWWAGKGKDYELKGPDKGNNSSSSVSSSSLISSSSSSNSPTATPKPSKVDESKDKSTAGVYAFSKEKITNTKEMVKFLSSKDAAAKVNVETMHELTGSNYFEATDLKNYVVVQPSVDFTYPGNTSFINGKLQPAGERIGHAGDIFFVFRCPTTGKFIIIRGACANLQMIIPKPKSKNPNDYGNLGNSDENHGGTGKISPAPTSIPTIELTPAVVSTDPGAATGIVGPEATPNPTLKPSTTPTPTLPPEPGVLPTGVVVHPKVTPTQFPSPWN